MNTSYGASNRFGHADYYQNLNNGMSNQQILNWINSNTGQLHSDRFGANELYSQIQSAARADSAAEAAAEARRAEIARAEQLQREAEARQAEKQRQMEISARTQAANTARAGLQSSMQIRSQPKSTKTAGTQGFKRRQMQVNPTAYNALLAGTQKKSNLPGVINV